MLRRTTTLAQKPGNTDQNLHKMPSKIPRLKRAQTMAVKPSVYVPSVEDCEKKIPKQWDLEGDLAGDPVAIALLLRIQSDCINESVSKPPTGHLATKHKPHNVSKFKPSQLLELAQFKEKPKPLKVNAANRSPKSSNVGQPKTPGIPGKKAGNKAVGFFSQDTKEAVPSRKSVTGARKVET